MLVTDQSEFRKNFGISEKFRKNFWARNKFRNSEIVSGGSFKVHKIKKRATILSNLNLASISNYDYYYPIHPESQPR